MKIYLISQNINNDYDTYSHFVVCAENEEKAKLVHKLDSQDDNYGSWVKDVEDITVEYLGEARKGMKEREILESFHAG